MRTIKQVLIDKHIELYQHNPWIVRSPGRINIIGEHTDYNMGFVLPAAVDNYVYISISKRTDQQIHLYSENFKESVQLDLANLQKQEKQWANYIIGVSALMADKLSYGFDMIIYGDVPIGAGMSSSAALESAAGYALNDVFNLNLSLLELAQIGQQCEHTYIGVNCGIMDQFASLFGRENQVIKLDCQSLAYSYFPLELDEYTFLLLNTNVNHSLASSGYNQARASCEAAVRQVKNYFPKIQSLREVTIPMLEKAYADEKNEDYRRAKYVIEEILRVEEVCLYLQVGDLEQVGKKMYETHEGLSKAYGVSCKELDFLVDHVRRFPEVLGARMMGGGFGGCTLNMVKATEVEKVVATAKEAYREAFGIELDYYQVKISNGTEILD